MQKRIWMIILELRHHAPFTVFGALTGVICMLALSGWGTQAHHRLFMVFHPLHVLLSAVVTASLFKMRTAKSSLPTVLAVGYFGAIGVATLSDCVVPFLGESIMGVAVPAHGALHSTPAGHEGDGHAGHEHHHGPEHSHGHDHGQLHQGSSPDTSDLQADHHQGSEMHLGFIEDWYIVNPAALLGILLAYWIPHERLHTRLPHAAHVLVSTWASSFHMLMNTHVDFTASIFAGAFLVLFVAVWLPCCISDIVFPILFVGEGKVPNCCALHTPAQEV